MNPCFHNSHTNVHERLIDCEKKPYVDLRTTVTLLSPGVAGKAVLLAYLERRPLGVEFYGLMRKQFSTDRDGSNVVFIGDLPYVLHPDFRLYLTATVPLDCKG